MSSILMHNPKGSVWHRWEPHIHTPDTKLNDQFSGENKWDDYLTRIEQATPAIRALGITDYFSIDNYVKVVQEKKNGRLAGVELIFPNIELRLSTGTARDKAINGHLLVSPDDPEHVKNTLRFLQELPFVVGGETYRCQKDDLIRLGKFHDTSIIDYGAALSAGINQFKVNFSDLEAAFKNSDWAKENILLAVSGTSGDGTAGLTNDASFTTLRQHIERTCNIIFASNDKQREFWIGNGAATIQYLNETYNGMKPCIHGSDAHSNDKVGKPDLDRYTWIKGDVKFEALRQICIEPASRVVIGSAPPNNQISSNVIEDVAFTNANWIDPTKIDLNAGLVAIIGARGSGKTALADLIAVGGTAIGSQLSDTSFIHRAGEYLADVTVGLNWLTGNATSQKVSEIEYEDLWDTPRVQYLSQQFVDRLCSAEGMTDELMDEIERVIFISHLPEDRLGVSNFQELLSQCAAIPRQERENQQEIIEDCSQRLTQERIKRINLPALEKKAADKSELIKTDKTNRQGLITTGNQSLVTDLENASAAFDKKSALYEQVKRKKQALEELKQAAVKAKASTFPDYTRKLTTQYAQTGLTAAQWNEFAINFKGDVTALLDTEIASADSTMQSIKGASLNITEYNQTSLIPQGTTLEQANYETLNHEVSRLKFLIGVNNEKGKQYTRITEKLVKEEAALDKLNIEVADAKDSPERSAVIQEERKVAYNEVFKAILAEEKELADLYLPLMVNLATQKGSLSKLSFKVHRIADTSKWAFQGEELLDLRKQGPFKGKGTLLDHANQELKKVWETGSADEISDALSKFREAHDASILEHAPVEKTDQTEFTNWLNRVSTWLYSTDHIQVNYSVQYDGVDIRQLSPGTRGIVLLLLYLAIDKEDDRPLIIDQPEENLDPKSIFDELVPLFREVKNRRQIIIVTHNANLVVNTDADQVIVASCGAHRTGQLPPITYESGGLENPVIRQKVCAILEGGEEAFKERAKRLRVTV